VESSCIVRNARGGEEDKKKGREVRKKAHQPRLRDFSSLLAFATRRKEDHEGKRKKKEGEEGEGKTGTAASVSFSFLSFVQENNTKGLERARGKRGRKKEKKKG